MRVLRKFEVINRIGYCGEHLRRLEMAGDFPRRIKLNPKGTAVGWLEHEVDDWIAGRAAERDTALGMGPGA